MDKESETTFSVETAPGGPTEKLFRDKRLLRQPSLNGSHGSKPPVGNPERNGSFRSNSGVSSAHFMGGGAFTSSSGRRMKSNEGKLKLFRSNEFADGKNEDSTQQFNEYIDTDKQKVMEHFTKSMEELSRRQRKLDHLQRCLKRYEIERAEAGQAVCRIEQRLKELQERTSDLLCPRNYAQKCGEFGLDLPTQNRFATGLLGFHSSGKNRLKVDVRTNQLYIDSQVMLDSDQANLSPINESDSTETSRRRGDKTARYFHRSVSGDLSEGDPEFTEVRELEARYKMLTEHLNAQRSRLAVADATVAKLARTLMKFSIMTPDQRSPGHGRNARNGRTPVDTSAIFHKRLSYTEFTSPKMLPPYCSVPNSTHDPHFYSLPNSSTLSPKNRQIRTTQQLQELAWVDQLTSAFQPSSATLGTPSCWNRDPLEPISAAMIAPVVNTTLSYSDSSQLSRKSPFRSIAMQIEKDQKLYEVQKPPRRQTDGEYIFLTNTDSAFVPWNNTPILERPVGHRPYQPFLSVPPIHYRRSFHLPEHSDCQLPVYGYSDAPVQPPPLPPKPSRHNFLSEGDNDAEPASMEDEEVSKFMTLSKDSWEQTSVKEQDMLALSSLPISARPPPPPYYVNIFHESANPSTKVALSAAQSQEFVQTRMISDSALCNSGTHGDRKLSNGVAIKSTHEEIRPQENCATECLKHPVQRKYIRPNMVSSVNLRAQLKKMGYPLDELTMREESSESLLRAQISSSRCLPFMLALWLRPGMRRSYRDKIRSQSAGVSRDHMSPFSMTLKSEFRVIVTETSCEGRLWIQQRASPNSRHRFWGTFRSSQRRTTQTGIPPTVTPTTAPSKAYTSRREMPDIWIQRWFVCDLRHQTFTSYERQRDEKPKDFIYISDVRAVKSSLDNDQNSKAPEGTANSPRKLSLESDNGLVLEDAITRDLDEQSEKSKSNEMRRKRLSIFHRVNRPDGDNSNSFMEATFQVETDSRVYTLKAASKQLVKLWTGVLRIAIDQQRKQSNV
ncbi:unnamed protein product [Calicophoron daubneyi]|uniref:PH domain-containing protein n=1 Tax=Calicophoron daubneyi TaxID=300641 RepID=A0AAV2T0U1_CALDB